MGINMDEDKFKRDANELFIKEVCKEIAVDESNKEILIGLLKSIEKSNKLLTDVLKRLAVMESHLLSIAKNTSRLPARGRD